jgi:hypothetical protein
MRGLISRSAIVAIAWMLIVILFAPTALASDVAGDASLWAEFVAWIQATFGDSNSSISASTETFDVWFMGRISVPGG